MKIDTAVRSVFETEKRKPVRSSIATFLKQYSDGARPPTNWRCSKLDTETFLDFVSKLGLREDKDYTVVRSSLDPHTIQLRWLKDTANRLTQALSTQPSGWLDAVYACAHSLEALPEGALCDIATVEPLADPIPVASGPTMSKIIADTTLRIAQSVKYAMFSTGDTWTTRHPTFTSTVVCNEAKILQSWGKWYTDVVHEHPQCVPPFAPMPVVEAYVRACLKESRPEWPDAPVFSCSELRIGSLSEQFVRELYRQVRIDESVPQGNLFMAPLESQFYEGCNSAPLSRYFTRNLRDWRTQSLQDKVGAWVQFNTLVRPTVDAAKFMLQPKNAAKYVRDLYTIAYGQDVMISGYTRIAVHNLFPDVPGADDLTCDPDDEDYNASLAERIDNETLKPHGLYYMGGLLVASPGMRVRQGSRHDLDSNSTESYWRNQRPELPTINPDDSLDKFALRTDELGKEWFAIVHGDLPTEHVPSNSAINPNLKTARLAALRNMFSDLEAHPARIDTLCSIGPGSHFLPGNTPSRWLKHNAFMSSICGVLRAYGPLRLDVVGSCSTIIHRIWSGMTTRMSMSSEDPCAFPWVPSLPVIDQILVDRELPHYAEYADKVTVALNRLQMHPDCQFRFTERERGSKERRNCVIMVETNVRASKFLDTVAKSGRVEDFSRRLRLAFTAPYVYRACSPEVIASSASTDVVVGTLTHNSRCSWFHSMATDLKTAGYQDMLKEYVAVTPGGLIQYPQIDQFPVNVSVTWDKEDRLIILFNLDGEAAQFLRLLYRTDHQLPLATAAYLKSKGKVPDGLFMMDSSLPQERNYIKYLKAQMKCGKFGNGAPSPATLTGGEFSTVYDPYALRGFDYDEFPDKCWYESCDAVRMMTVLGVQ